MSESTPQTVWLTPDAHERLVQELVGLVEVGRPEVSARIAAAREEGDLSENGGYHAAREEQGQMEARIRQLEDILNRAQVGDAPEDPEVVGAGSQVTIAFDGDPDDTDTFLLGSREVLGLDDSVAANVYSPQSPIGAAVLGKRPGDSVTYTAPNGRDITVVVKSVAPFSA